MTYDAIVVGLGAMGSATLYQLARRGVRCLGIDRFTPPHDRGSSHGETRITRCGVGEGDVYSGLAIRSHAIWRELEAETEIPLLLECGFLAIDGAGEGAEFHGKRGFFETTVASADRFGVPYERLDADEARRRFPQFRLAGHERLYFEPGGGLVFPERCVAAQLDRARTMRAEVATDAPVLSIEPDGDGVAVTTSERTYHAARAVVAAGGWAPGLARGGLSGVRLLRQALHWFEPTDARLYDAERCPTYIWAHGRRSEDSFYGFPIVAGLTPGVKVATEQYSHALAQPEAMRREVEPCEAAAMFAEHLAGRLEGVTPSPIRGTACFYTQTPDSDFIVDADDGNARVLLVSACSGHGFKHSAGLGESVAAQLADGGRPSDRFLLARAALR